MMEDNVTEDKIWIIKELTSFFMDKGISPDISGYLTVLIALAALAAVVYIIDLVLNSVVVKILHKATARTRTKWDDYLLSRHFFKRSSRLIINVVIIDAVGYLLQGHNSILINIITTILQLTAIVLVVMMLFSLLDSLNDVYKTLARSKEKSIKNYLQTIKVIIYATAVILVLVIIFDIQIASFFTGIATFAAVLTLVFKDTILGFIASIQLSAQDMVRLGDWIEIPASDVNGEVVDLNLTTVKVQNWNKTFSYVPIYDLTNSPFVNWRGMEAGAGRRFTKILYLDFTTVRTLSLEEVVALKDNELLSTYYKEMVGDRQSKEDRTNISLLRRYLTAYMVAHPYVNSALTTMVRYRDIEDVGLPMQLYGFTITRRWVAYESNVCEIMEHAICAVEELGLKMFQKTSSLYPHFYHTPAPTDTSLEIPRAEDM